MSLDIHAVVEDAQDQYLVVDLALVDEPMPAATSALGYVQCVYARP